MMTLPYQALISGIACLWTYGKTLCFIIILPLNKYVCYSLNGGKDTLINHKISKFFCFVPY